MSLSASQRQIYDAQRALAESWRRLRDVWNDDAAEAFYEEYIRPIEPAARSAMHAMASMSEVQHRALKECSAVE